MTERKNVEPVTDGEPTDLREMARRNHEAAIESGMYFCPKCGTPEGYSLISCTACAARLRARETPPEVVGYVALVFSDYDKQYRVRAFVGAAKYTSAWCDEPELDVYRVVGPALPADEGVEP